MNLLDIIFPKRCVECNKIGTYFCQECRAKIVYTTHQICPVCGGWAIDGKTHPKCQNRYTIDSLTSVFHYDGVIKKAVKLLKYRFVSDLAKEFVELVPSSFFQSTLRLCSGQAINNPPAGGSSILIPIPLHPVRKRFRGFNQAEILGKLIATKLNTQITTNVLKRVKKTKPQVEMKDREKRLANMEGVFSVNKSSIDKLSTIILFDDVFTTGATLNSAANVLKRAGIKKVWGVVLAHG